MWLAPMNKTIYLRDEEGPVWERARELADDKLSPVIVSALKFFIAKTEAASKGFERIEVSFNDFDDHDLPKRKAFYGKWIYTPDDPCTYVDKREEVIHSYAVALTAKGAAVVFSWSSDTESPQWAERFFVYPSLERAANDSSVNFAVVSAIKKLGVPVEELDI